MKNCEIKHLIEVASELTSKHFGEKELGTYPFGIADFASAPIATTRKHYIRAFWTQINELATHAYGGQRLEKFTLESLRELFVQRQSERIKLIYVRTWIQVSFPTISFLINTSESGIYITATNMGTYPVKMTAQHLIDMLIAIDDYLSTDLDSHIKDIITSTCAEVKANQMLTTTAMSLVEDMIDGKDLALKLRLHKGKMYCDIHDLRYWRKTITFRTSIETLREDLRINCLESKVSINLKRDNEKMLAAAADWL
jgi:hypothetical protein